MVSPMIGTAAVHSSWPKCRLLQAIWVFAIGSFLTKRKYAEVEYLYLIECTKLLLPKAAVRRKMAMLVKMPSVGPLIMGRVRVPRNRKKTMTRLWPEQRNKGTKTRTGVVFLPSADPKRDHYGRNGCHSPESGALRQSRRECHCRQSRVDRITTWGGGLDALNNAW